MRRTAAAALGILILAAALALAVHGTGDHARPDRGPSDAATPWTAAQIERDALASMRRLHSVHVTGQMSSGGEMSTIDLQTTKRGDCVGHIGYGGKGHIDLRVAEGRAYFRGDEAFWRMVAGADGARVMQKVGDRWVTGDPTVEGIGKACDLKAFFKMKVDDDSTIVHGETADGFGQIVTIRGFDEGRLALVRVSTTSPHYVVHVDEAGGFSLDFSSFDLPVRVRAPAEQDVYDLSRTV